MDVLGLTFAELQQVAPLRPHQIASLRAWYGGLMRDRCLPDEATGPAAAPSNDPLPDFPLPAADPLDETLRTVSLSVQLLPIVRLARDGDLTKFIQRTPDGLEVESVVVPMRRKGREWKTLCVSSQIGCAHRCAFCETGQLGLLRNLTAGEIVGQVVAARRLLGEDIRNVVFMGMGEPLDNFDAVVQAIRVLTEPRGLSLGKERIKISTVGRVAGIRRLADLGWRRITLAVSLNAPNDAIRSRIMPVSRLEPMAAVREALLAYPTRRHQYFMIEYVLIPGVNDAREHAGELADFLRPLRCVVNVIPHNPRRASPWPAPTQEEVVRFLDWLDQAGQLRTLRITKGQAQMAACGQLGNRALRPPDHAVCP